jgi:hypothetical protein
MTKRKELYDDEGNRVAVIPKHIRRIGKAEPKPVYEDTPATFADVMDTPERITHNARGDTVVRRRIR